MTIPERVVERVITNIDVVGECWISRYSIGSHGYSQIGWKDGGRRFATLCHRVAWVHVFGPIPEGMTVDHICRQRRCVNPAHLRLLTNVDNARDNGMARRTACPAGHPYDDENTYRRANGHRQCRACATERRAA